MQTLTPNNEIEQTGLVISYFGNSVAVEDATRQVVQCQLHRNQELPVVGDRVRWHFATLETGVITSIEKRSSLLIRGDGRGNKKPVAANINLIIIVMAPPPIFSEYLIDRYLTAAELLSIPSALVLNKCDLLTESNQEIALKRLYAYESIPYPVFLSSIYEQQKIDAFAQYLKDKAAVLVGPSGVGKSSIIAALTKTTTIRTNQVSPKGIGKHTTTTTRLYHLPNGGYVIDSPGVREFNLWRISQQEVLKGFKEFHGLAACKFRDCLHEVEPGCAIIASQLKGEINQARYESYLALIKEAKNNYSAFAIQKKDKRDRKK